MGLVHLALRWVTTLESWVVKNMIFFVVAMIFVVVAKMFVYRKVAHAVNGYHLA